MAKKKYYLRVEKYAERYTYQNNIRVVEEFNEFDKIYDNTIFIRYFELKLAKELLPDEKENYQGHDPRQNCANEPIFIFP